MTEKQKHEEAAAETQLSSQTHLQNDPDEQTEAGKPVDGQIFITIMENGNWAEMKLSKPQSGGASISKEQIKSTLEKAGIVYGILDDVIEETALQPVYDAPIKIAEGKLPIHGQDGSLQYFFNLENPLAPKETKNGLIDFKNLNFVQNFNKDQKLAEIIPPTAGEDGCNILGHRLEAKAGTPILDVCGDNTYLSEDGKFILASCGGSPIIKKKKISISRVITVENVDISTGNLLYVGSIVVKGNVNAGFTVSASEGIIVKGTVENAKLISSQDITVGQGISGSNSKVIAGGNIRTGFMENCTVEANGDIYADAILHADIKCHGKIVVSGRRGCIIGGVCRAAHSITAKDMGNEKYVPTSVEVFGPFFLEQKLDELNQKVQVQNEEIKKTDELLVKLDLAEKLQPTEDTAKIKENATFTREKHQQTLEKLQKEIETLQAQIADFGECKISTERYMYENVMVIINNAKKENESVRNHCSAVNVEGQIIIC